MSNLRVAAVGSGYFSQFHYDAWRRLPVELVGVCDLDLRNMHLVEAVYQSSQTGGWVKP